MTEEKTNLLKEKFANVLTTGELEPFTLFGFECGDGWFKVIHDALELIQIHCERNKTETEAEQIKEKFGGLRMYMSRTDDVINTIIAWAERRAHRTCENCGKEDYTTVKLRQYGWWRTLCDDCESERQSKRASGPAH